MPGGLFLCQLMNYNSGLDAMENPIHSLTVREQSGSLIGILGKEGSGKTTLLKLLAGHIAPDKGNIEINGYDLQKNRYLLKDIIGYVPEEDLLFEELTVYDNLLMNARLYYSSLPVMK